MSLKKNDNTFSAADIEKYHKGLLSAKEMNALEKAALDDPLLADALEGFAMKNIDRVADLAELESRLARRIQGENKMMPVAATERSTFSWWKLAAMIVLIAGASVIVYQLAFNKRSPEIAEASRKESPKSTASDADTITAPAASGLDSNLDKAVSNQQREQKPGENKISVTPLSDEKDGQAKVKPAPSVKNEPIPNSVTSDNNPPASVLEKDKEVAVTDIAAPKSSAEKQAELKEDNQQQQAGVVASNTRQKRAVAAPAQGTENLYKYQRNRATNSPHVFRGRVTDAQNNALPFSNITNTDDNIGTYADANGYFNLTSPDSVLNVRVSSIGFEANNVQLQNNIPNNRVLLQEDRNNLAEVVISNKKINSQRLENNTMVLDEPEPVDGWGNYDLYLANNLKEPDPKGRPSTSPGVVELSFDVTKAGEPVNIKVKKSLCEACDKEAIRLLKEGPKWKKKGKRSKAKVSISF